jgi:hypothetical protein
VLGIVPKDNIRRKRLDGISEAHEAIPKFAVMLSLIGNVGQNAGAAADAL